MTDRKEDRPTPENKIEVPASLLEEALIIFHAYEPSVSDGEREVREILKLALANR